MFYLLPLSFSLNHSVFVVVVVVVVCLFFFFLFCTGKRSKSAQECRIALYKSDHQQQQRTELRSCVKVTELERSSVVKVEVTVLGSRP